MKNLRLTLFNNTQNPSLQSSIHKYKSHKDTKANRKTIYKTKLPLYIYKHE